jgi:type II secretory pathway predicted ATPase ExeA
MTNPLTSQQRRAFLSAPDPQRYYAASAIEEARQRIVRSIARNEGPALVVGAVGTGKSLLLAVLAEQFEPRMSVVRLPGAQLCTRRALLQMILCELRLPYRGMDEGELRLSIREHLLGPAASEPLLREPSPSGRGQGEGAPRTTSPPSRPRRMLVLVDEADALPTRLLEELRVLTNFVARGIPLVSLVLAGSPILEERFADPQLDMFSQRLSCRCYLAPFTREETFQYVRSQVSAVGVKPEKWFDPEALAAVHAVTGGAPRLVNQLGDQLVWLIEETGCQPLDAALVQQAWSDLQQLPAPWNTDAHSSLSSAQISAGPFASVGGLEGGVIEFGELDEDFSASPRAPAGIFSAAAGIFSEAAPGDSGVNIPHAAHDAADELFVGHDFIPRPLAHDFDDDLPASIPIGQARSVRNADLGVYDAAIDATEKLVDELNDFDMLELASNDLEPLVEPEPPAPKIADNPFTEPFAEEEVIVDPYSGFETQTLRTARQVLNRIDRTFAAELARCELRKSGPLAPSLAAKPAVVSPDPSEPSPPGRGQGESAPPPISPLPSATAVPLAPNPAPGGPDVPGEKLAPDSGPGEPKRTASSPSPTATLTPPAADLLVVDDDQSCAAAIVPGRQFRRLFTSLEAAAPSRALQR